jgi:hypothetical protein
MFPLVETPTLNDLHDAFPIKWHPEGTISTERPDKVSKLDHKLPRGQLTQRGLDQLRRIGRYFRRRYVNKLQFLSDHSECLVRSTPSNRTVQSTQSFLHGLLFDDDGCGPPLAPLAPAASGSGSEGAPPLPDSLATPPLSDSLATPIAATPLPPAVTSPTKPVAVLPVTVYSKLEEETLFFMRGEKTHDVVKEAHTADEGVAVNTMAEELAEEIRLRERFKLNKGDRIPLDFWMSLHECLVCAETHNVKLEPPMDIDYSYIPRITEVTYRLYTIPMKFDAYLHHTCSPFLVELMSHIQIATSDAPSSTDAQQKPMFVNNSSFSSIFSHSRGTSGVASHSLPVDTKTKVVVFSAHDTSLMHVLAVFNSNNGWPGYAASVAFEIYQDKSSGEHFILLNRCDAGSAFLDCEHGGLKDGSITMDGASLIRMEDAVTRIESIINLKSFL